MFKSLSPRLARGLSHMSRLRHFSCKHDCNDAILEALAKGCSDSLLVLDVENSKVRDPEYLKITQQNITNYLHLFEGSGRQEPVADLLVCQPRGAEHFQHFFVR